MASPKTHRGGTYIVSQGPGLYGESYYKWKLFGKVLWAPDNTGPSFPSGPGVSLEVRHGGGYGLWRFRAESDLTDCVTPSFYRLRNRGSEKVSGFSKVTLGCWPTSGASQVCGFPGPGSFCSFTHCHVLPLPVRVGWASRVRRAKRKPLISLPQGPGCVGRPGTVGMRRGGQQ